MQFKGVVSVFWWGLTIVVVFMCFYYVISAMSSGEVDAFTVALGAVPIAIAIAMAWMMIDNRVELGDDAVLVRMGPIRLRVPYHDIVRVSDYRLQGAVIALALGKDRVTIERRGGTQVVVSVEDKAGFIDELQRKVSTQRGLPHS